MLCHAARALAIFGPCPLFCTATRDVNTRLGRIRAICLILLPQ